VIHEIDDALKQVLEALGAAQGGIEVAFDAPTDEWSNKRQGPAVDCYLYSIKENLDLRNRMWGTVPRGDGTADHHRLPPRQYQLSYMVTVWAGRPEDEHRILAVLVDGLARLDSITLPDGATGDDDPLELPMSVALPQERMFPDLWSSMKTVVRPALDVVITAPFGPRTRPVAPPVTEPPRLDVFDEQGELLDVAGAAVGAQDRERVLAEGADRRSPWPVDSFAGEQVGPRRPRPVAPAPGDGRP
jgi:hypothetical protein